MNSDDIRSELEAEKTRVLMMTAGWKETIRQLSVWQKIADDLATELTLEQNPGYRCAALDSYDAARRALPFAIAANNDLLARKGL